MIVLSECEIFKKGEGEIDFLSDLMFLIKELLIFDLKGQCF